MTKNIFSIGTDPEFFIINQKGTLISSIGIVEGEKHNPVILQNGASLSCDNVAVEVATNPAIGVKEFTKEIRQTFFNMLNHIPSEYKVSVRSSATFHPEQLQDPRSQMFGCEPDFNAWTMTINSAPDRGKNPNLRSCGGHIHIGNVKGYEFLESDEGKIDTVKALDYILGITSVILDDSLDSKERRKLYGKAGCYRPTEYGIEYRTLSNFWLAHPFIIRLVYNLVEDALNSVKDNSYMDIVDKVNPYEMFDIINDSDVNRAKKVFFEHIAKLLSPQTRRLYRRYFQSVRETIKVLSFDKAWFNHMLEN